MARTDTLENYLTDVATAIRAKSGSQAVIPAASFDTAIRNIPSGGGGTTDIYKVASIQEREALSPNENDICLVYNKEMGEVDETTVSDTFFFPETVVLEEQISDYIYGEFYSDSGRVSYDISPDRVRISVMDDDQGNYYEIEYTTQDNLTYTTQGSQTVTFSSTLSYQGYGEDFNPIIGKFIQAITLTFPGIYQYLNSSWEYLDIKTNLDSSDLLLNKVAYTNNGFITGTTDLNKYKQIHFATIKTLPQEPTQGIYYYIVSPNGYTSYSLYTTNKDMLRSSSLAKDLQYSGITPKGTISSMIDYNGTTYLVDDAGCIYSFDGTALVKIYDMNKSYGDVLSACVGSYVYLFYSSGSTGSAIKYNLANGSASSIAKKPDGTESGGLIVIDNNTLMYCRSNKRYNYNISSNSWSTTTIPSGKFNTNANIVFIKVEDGFAYFTQSTDLYKYNLADNTFTRKSVPGTSSSGYVQKILGSDYMMNTQTNSIIKFNSNLEDFLVCRFNSPSSTQNMLGSSTFMYDNKIHIFWKGTSIDTKHYIVTVNEDLNLSNSEFDYYHYTGVIVCLSTNDSDGIVLNNKLLNMVYGVGFAGRVKDIYFYQYGRNKTSEVYQGVNGSFTQLFSYSDYV